MKSKTDIVELFNEAQIKNTYLKVCAPMVRYSKVQFRTLVKNFGVDLCFTPMILADSFCQNEKARLSEFSTTVNDSPVIAQFAANNVDDFVDASTLVSPYVDGVDLNCGCPQGWAMKDGYGSALLGKPEIIYDLVKGIRNNLPHNFSVSVKIRILKDIKKTIEMCKQLEMCGVTFLTVHGRTPAQKSSGDIKREALRDVCECIKIPVIANGGVKTLDDANDLFEAVNCRGVMTASAILSNPALFSGANKTPIDCIRIWKHLKDSAEDRISLQCYHHHLVFMMDKILTKPQKHEFNCLSSFESIDDYLYNNILLDNTENDCKYNYQMGEFISCEYPEEITLKHSRKCRGCGKSVCYCICQKYDCSNTNGAYFNDYVSDELDYMDSNIFDEPT